MFAYQNLKAVTLLKNIAPYSSEKTKELLQMLTEDMPDRTNIVQTMLNELEMIIFSGMKKKDIIQSMILIACQNIQENLDFDKLASRIGVLRNYKTILSFIDQTEDFKTVYEKNFERYIRKGIELKLLNPELEERFNIKELAKYLAPERDDMYSYTGLETAFKRYMLRDRSKAHKLIETIQYMRMRVAMGISLKEKEPDLWAKRFYDVYSKLEGTPGGSTNIGAGTTFPVLSNCYILDTQDDTNHIFDNVKNVALISKATGGIGLSVSKLRASGSVVKSNNTKSTGPIPFIKVMDTTVKSMSRAGKKHGAIAIYMENWHYDFDDFLDLRLNSGDDYRRVRTADTAVHISDEFMKRVINQEMWYLFDPAETPDLTELYGNEFSKRYEHYVKLADEGRIKLFKKIPALEQMKKMISNLLSSSHPWLTWKDNINLRALNNNTGTIHSSNLCTEITLPQDRDNIAVCNLAYLNIAVHFKNAEKLEEKIDWIKLEASTRTLIRHLDNLLEVNMSPLKETKNSDENNRAVGLGMSGLADVLEKVGLSYESEEAFDFVDKVWEFVSYVGIDESCNLAEEKGSYPNFHGSMWSKGYVPIDTLAKVASDRVGIEWDGKNLSEIKKEVLNKNPKNILNTIKVKINDGIKNAKTEDSKELWQIFNQLTELIDKNSPEKVEEELIETRKVNLNVGSGIDLVQDTTTNLDWDRLRERVKKGVRNATIMALAPNASTGLLVGTTPGIDPRFSNIFSRATSRGKFLDVNPNLVRKLQELNLWDVTKARILANYGDISTIDEIPDDIKNIYKTSFQISPIAYLEIASRIQKWIDQSISRNMYLETKDVEKTMEVYIEAWRRGLKTTYYLFTKPKQSAEQSMVKVNKTLDMNKKGFGQILEVSATVEKKVELASETKLAETPKFGFGSVRAQKIVEDDVNLKQEVPASLVNSASKWEPFVKACPADPAERALCEGCQ